MQLLFEAPTSTRAPTGLGLLPGDGDAAATRRGLKIPHIGWNDVTFERAVAR